MLNVKPVPAVRSGDIAQDFVPNPALEIVTGENAVTAVPWLYEYELLVAVVVNGVSALTVNLNELVLLCGTGFESVTVTMYVALLTS